MTNHPISLCDRFGLAAETRPFVPSFLPPERLPKLTPEDVRKLVWEGGLPGAEGRRGKARAAFFEDLLERALTQDLRGVRPAMRRTFRAFLKELALRTARELHIGEISVAVGVSDKTVKAWLRAAEEIGLIWRLEAYRAEPGTCPKLQLVRSPKIHFADTGLAAHLCGIRRPEDLAGPIHEEAFFETFVVNEIRKSWMKGEDGINGSTPPDAPPLCFLRDSHSGKRIELLIRANGVLHPVGVRAHVAPRPDAAKDFAVLSDLPEPVGHGAVICMCGQPYALSDTVTAHSILAI